MTVEQMIVLMFAVFLFVGAFFGAKAGSKISLIMGIASGSLILLGDIIVHFNKKSGFLFLMIIAGLLVVSFSQRVLKTKKMMPSGMLLIAGTLFFGFTIFTFINS
ncbi:MAG: TMEM14 family protein [Candidatus Omnitrophica bacterium]|nr:TMEM14 family protein [Candidatus Omnitrophota bacterium]